MEKMKITGIMCTNCVQHVNNVLAGLPGICGLDVQRVKNEAVVSYDDQKVEAEKITAEMDAEGYEAHRIDS